MFPAHIISYEKFRVTGCELRVGSIAFHGFRVTQRDVKSCYEKFPTRSREAAKRQKIRDSRLANSLPVFMNLLIEASSLRFLSDRKIPAGQEISCVGRKKKILPGDFMFLQKRV